MSRLIIFALLVLVASAQGFQATPNQRELTDACLSDISKIATAIPKIIDDIQRGDMISLMTDVMSTIPLLNQTKSHCQYFDGVDMVNQTTWNNVRYCAQSFSPICDSLEVVLMDVIHGKFTNVYDDVLVVLRNAAYSLRVCANIADFIEYPKNILNFYNTTQCWNKHQYSANLLHAITHNLQVGNYTGALVLVLPFVSATADSLRFCSVNTTTSLYTNPMKFNSYSFLEHEVEVKNDDCKVKFAEIMQALTAEPQDLTKLVQMVPKMKNCAQKLDLANLVKSPVVRQIVSASMAKTFA